MEPILDNQRPLCEVRKCCRLNNNLPSYITVSILNWTTLNELTAIKCSKALNSPRLRLSIAEMMTPKTIWRASVTIKTVKVRRLARERLLRVVGTMMKRRRKTSGASLIYPFTDMLIGGRTKYVRFRADQHMKLFLLTYKRHYHIAIELLGTGNYCHKHLCASGK